MFSTVHCRLLQNVKSDASQERTEISHFMLKDRSKQSAAFCSSSSPFPINDLRRNERKHKKLNLKCNSKLADGR